MSIHEPFDHLISGVRIYSKIGTIRQRHFQKPRMIDEIMLTNMKIAIFVIVSCSPFLQLGPIVSPTIKLGTRLNALCILYGTLVEDWSEMGMLLNINRAIIIPRAMIHLYFPVSARYKNGATRYKRTINETNHAHRWNSQYSRVLRQRILSHKEYSPKSINIKQDGMKTIK